MKVKVHLLSMPNKELEWEFPDGSKVRELKNKLREYSNRPFQPWFVVLPGGIHVHIDTTLINDQDYWGVMAVETRHDESCPIAPRGPIVMLPDGRIPLGPQQLPLGYDRHAEDPWANVQGASDTEWQRQLGQTLYILPAVHKHLVISYSMGNMLFGERGLSLGSHWTSWALHRGPQKMYCFARPIQDDEMKSFDLLVQQGIYASLC